MPMDRRSFMKASGVAAALGVTGLAGCSGILGSSSGASNWQYDPETLADTQTRFFGSMQYGNLYSMRDELPGTMGENFEVDSESPIKPEDIDLLSGVGGGQVSMQTGSGAFFGSVAVTGSYDVDAIESQISSQGSAQQSGEYEGYTLYSGTNLNQQVPGDQMPTDTDATATAALSEEAMILGVTVSQSGSLDVSGQDTVETMIDAEAGNAPRIDENSKYAKKLHDKLGGATMVVGGEVDGALVDTYQDQYGSGGMGGEMMNGLRAGGLSADIGSSTTTYKFGIVYNNSSNAESSGIVGLVNMMKQRLTEQEAINEVNANRSGDTIVVTVKGDTQTLLSQGENQVPMGAVGGNAVPIDY